ncbi:MAG: NrfD/PsrC family molybdoenzyme membrane anchor subunit [Armatimonadota bacterium]|nr:NrfD/PsrC family molybdoenzyme membrane anchor subunit [Armatimonadota bacterium]
MARVRGEHPLLRVLTTAGPAYWVAVAALATVVLAAGYAYITRQLAFGLGVTGLNTQVTWGLYIVNFVYFIGLSAGGIIVAALAHAAGVRRLEPVGRIAELGAISCLVLATIFITLDLGRPERLWHLLIYGRPGSPLTWDVIVIILYLLTALALGYFSARRDVVKLMALLPHRKRLYRWLALGRLDLSDAAVHRDQGILRALAVVSIPMAVALHSVTAWILGLLKAQPGWHSALIAPLFVASAVASGLALVILSTVVARALLRVPVAEEVIYSLGRVLALVLPVLGYFLFAELLTVTYARETAPAAIFYDIMQGRLAPLFWFDLVLGIVVPLGILWFPGLPARWVIRLPSPALRPAAAAAAVVLLLGALWMTVRAPQAAVELPAAALRAWAMAAAVIAALALLPSLMPTRTAAIGVAAGLVVMGVFAERTLIVVPSQFHRLLPFPSGAYTPTPTEWLITAGVYALGGLSFLTLAKILPIVPLEADDGPAEAHGPKS